MSARTVIYNRLAGYEPLTAQLAAKAPEVGPGPAIYETWAAPGSSMPYINLVYDFSAGDHEAKREGLLTVHIFTSGYDTLKIESIQQEVINALDWQILRGGAVGPVRLYLQNEAEQEEDKEGILHWIVTFSVVHWRRNFIQHLTN